MRMQGHERQGHLGQEVLLVIRFTVPPLGNVNPYASL